MKFEFCDFENFFKFSKKRCAVPLWLSGPLWSRPN